LRVVLADDHFLVREGLAALLATTPDIEVVAAVEDADLLREAVDEHHPDAVLTDIRMPPGNATDGIDAALEIRRRHPDVGVVVLSQHIEEEYVRGLFVEGVGRVGLSAQGPGRAAGGAGGRPAPYRARRVRAGPEGGRPARLFAPWQPAVHPHRA
jgi:DNA-binding NarL/FixJ family response regulator